MSSGHRIVVSGIVLGALSACGDQRAEEIAEEAVDSQELALSEGALVAVSADGAEQGMRAEEAAAAAAKISPQRLTPPGCMTATVEGTKVTYNLDGCSGPAGLVKVTGSITAVFATAGPALQITATGSGVRVNRAVLDVDAVATVTQSGTTRTVSVTTKGSGTGPRGHHLERHGSYVATKDSATSCATLDGEWALEVGTRERTTTISGLRRCPDACPAGGGTIVHKGLFGRTVTVTFDGSNAARWTTSFGRSGTVDLRCGS